MERIPHEQNPLYSLEWDALKKVILERQPKLVFDIGANIGDWYNTMRPFLRVPGLAQPRVHLFEPIPRLAQQILTRFWKEDGIFVHPIGFSDVETTLEVNAYNCWTLLTDEQAQVSHAERSLPFVGVDNFSIMLTTLDKYVTSQGELPDFVKMDVDGYEVRLLRGAKRALAHRPPMLFELWDGCQRFLGDSVEEMCRLIYEDLGYRVWNLNGTYCCPDVPTLITQIPYGSSYDVLLLAEGEKP